MYRVVEERNGWVVMDKGIYREGVGRGNGKGLVNMHNYGNAWIADKYSMTLSQWLNHYSKHALFE